MTEARPCCRQTLSRCALVSDHSASSTPYTVLARRFRPQTFDDVVGQEPIARALQNAIRSGRVAHAYLFTGARGVGKTSMARIFAKALNCPHAADAVPCNRCDACLAISAGSDVDVLEIDGASNRGIDDIRQLRANVHVRSMRSANKIYIIDEVHMLTKEAFNALLKTLEEPPANVKFLFCTTEPTKLPDTILSRCQRFDFGTIATGSIAERLAHIASTEGIEVDPNAVELVARRAAGSMRDSQSLFDQLLSFGEDGITVDDVHRLLGTAPDERLLELVDAMIARRHDVVLKLLDEALQQGSQIGPLGDQLVEYLRDLMIVQAGAEEVPLSSVSERLRDRLHEQSQQWGLNTILAALQILAETKARMQRSHSARALMELALVRISLLEDLEEISRLIQNLGTGQAPASDAQTGSRPASRSKERSQRFREKLTSQSSERTSSSQRPSEAQQNLTGSDPTGRQASMSIMTEEQSDSDPRSERGETVSKLIQVTPETVEEYWTQVLTVAPDALENHLKNACNIAISGPNVLEITFPRTYLFSMKYCQRPEAMEQIRSLVAQMSSNVTDFRFVLDSRTPAAQPARPADDPDLENRLRPVVVESDPFVQSAVSIFGGSVVDVRKVLGVPSTDSREEAEEATD